MSNVEDRNILNLVYGNILYEEGDPAINFYLIKEGEIEISKKI